MSENILDRRETQLLWDAIAGVSPYGALSVRDGFLIEFGQAVAKRRLPPELVRRMREVYTDAQILRLTDLAAQGLAARLLREVIPKSLSA